MTKAEYEREIGRLGLTDAKIMAGVRPHGRFTVPMLHEITGRGDGHTKEIRRLRRKGLIREIGPDLYAKNAGMKPMQYEVVPPGEVEQEREAYAARAKPPNGNGTPPRPVSREAFLHARIAELRRTENGDPENFAALRIRVMQLTIQFAQIARKAFWRHASELQRKLLRDSIDRHWEALREHLAELEEHVDVLAVADEALRVRAKDDDTRSKIRKAETLMRDSAAHEGEVASARRRIRALKAKLPPEA